jgi:hypothetical protein
MTDKNDAGLFFSFGLFRLISNWEILLLYRWNRREMVSDTLKWRPQTMSQWRCTIGREEAR